MTDENSIPKLIHLATIRKGRNTECLLLRKNGDCEYTWYCNDETPTEVSAPTITQALHKANRHWAAQGFKPMNCGWRYTLPERDEHGRSAYFYEMVASHSSLTGPYYDPDYGHQCFVQFAPQETLDLWKKLEEQGKL